MLNKHLATHVKTNDSLLIKNYFYFQIVSLTVVFTGVNTNKKYVYAKFRMNNGFVNFA